MTFASPGNEGAIMFVWSERQGVEERMPTAIHPEPSSDPIHEPKGLPILVVDDEPMMRTFLVSSLRGCGYAVLSAGSAEEAFEVVNNLQDHIALVLTDMQMPGNSGVDLIRSVRRLQPEMPVIAMSGNLGEWIADLPGIRCIAKPFSMKTLLGEIGHAFDMRAAPQRSRA